MPSAYARAITLEMQIPFYTGVHFVNVKQVIPWNAMLRIAAITTPQYCSLDLHAVPTLHSMT